MKRLLPRFLAHGIDAFVPHDLRRTGRTTLGRLGVSPFIGERVINHSKDVLEETYDLWDYFDEKCEALERLEKYRRALLSSDSQEQRVRHMATRQSKTCNHARPGFKPGATERYEGTSDR